MPQFVVVTQVLVAERGADYALHYQPAVLAFCQFGVAHAVKASSEPLCFVAEELSPLRSPDAPPIGEKCGLAESVPRTITGLRPIE